MRIFPRSWRSLPNRALHDQEVVSVCIALQHIKDQGNLDRLPATRSHRLALMTTATRQGLAVWNRSSDRYDLTGFGQQRLGAYGSSLALDRSAANARRRRFSSRQTFAIALGTAACIGGLVWASPRVATHISLALASTPRSIVEIPEVATGPLIDVPCGQPHIAPEKRNCLGTVGRNIGSTTPDRPVRGLTAFPDRPQILAVVTPPNRPHPEPDRTAGPDPQGGSVNPTGGPASGSEPRAGHTSNEVSSSLLDIPRAAALDRVEPVTLVTPPAADQTPEENPLDARAATAFDPPPASANAAKPVERSRAHSSSQRRLTQSKKLRWRHNDFWDDWPDRPAGNMVRTLRTDRGQRTAARRNGNEVRDGLAFMDNDHRSRPGFFSWMFR
jgi:hypothetical protein